MDRIKQLMEEKGLKPIDPKTLKPSINKSSSFVPIVTTTNNGSTLTREEILKSLEASKEKARKKYATTSIDKEKTGLSGDLAKRGESLKETFKKTATGEITPVEAGVRTVGTAIGAVSDIAGTAITKGLKAITPDSIENALKEGFSKFAKTEIGQKGLSALAKGGEAYANFKKENPRIATNLEAIGNIATAIPVPIGPEAKIIGTALKPVSYASKTVKKLTPAVSGITKGTIEAYTRIPIKELKTIIEKNEIVGNAIKLGVDRDMVTKEITDKIVKQKETFENIFNKSYNFFSQKDSKNVSDILSKVINKDDIKNTNKASFSGVRNVFNDVMNKNNLTPIYDKIGKLKAFEKTRETKKIDDANLKNIINDFNQYINYDNINARQFLTLRNAIDDSLKTAKGNYQSVLKDLRGALNEKVRPSFVGLDKLDKAYQLYKEEFIDPVYNYFFKNRSKVFGGSVPLETQMQRMATLVNPNKKRKLEQLSKFVPEAEERLNILKTVEKIELAKGVQTADYLKTAVRTGAVGAGILSGQWVLSSVAFLLTYPEIIVPILIKYGKVKNKNVMPILNKIKKAISLNGIDKTIINDAAKTYLFRSAVKEGIKNNYGENNIGNNE